MRCLIPLVAGVAMVVTTVLLLAQAGGPSLDGAVLTVVEDGQPRSYALTPLPTRAPDAGDPAEIDLTQHGSLVFVHALGGAADPLTTRYTWDFGDGSAPLPGFNAAHHFASPGTYTLTLSAQTGATTHTALRQITVNPDTRRTLHVSSTGDDAHDGSVDRPLRTLSAAAAVASDDVRILLKRGDTFNVSATQVRPGRNVFISAYGDPSADKPVIRYTGPATGEPIIRCSDSSANVVIDGLTFDSVVDHTDKKGAANALLAAGKGIALLNCTVLNVNYGVNANGRPQGLLIENCDAPLLTGVRSYFAWVQGSDISIIHCNVANSTREHAIRAWEFSRLLIHGCTLANRDRTGDGDRYDIAKNTINLQAGEYAYVSRSVLRGPSSIGPLGKTDGLKYRQQRSRTYVLEQNRFIGSGLGIQHGLSGVMLRENAFDVPDTRAISIDGHDAEYERGVADVSLFANTATNPGTRGAFLYVGGKVDGITLDSNRYTAPRLLPGANESAAIYVNDADCASFRAIRHNAWTVGPPRPFAKGGVMYVWPKWSDAQGYLDPKEWSQLPQVQDDVIEIK